MAITIQNARRKSNRRQSHRRKGNIETTKIEGEGDKGQEVTIRCETAPSKERRNQRLAGLKNLQWNGAKPPYLGIRKKHRKGE